MLDLGDDIFDAICVATERPDEPLRYRKPSPRFAEEMVKRYAAYGRRLYYVGDSPSDLVTAVNAGGLGLGVRTGVLSLNDVVPSSLSDERLAMFNNFGEAADRILADMTRGA